jgi:hypothetical protein
MTSICECRFTEAPASCLIRGESVQLVAANHVQDHADVRVLAFGSERIVKGFAFVTSENASIPYGDRIKWSLLVNEVRPDDERCGWILVFGNLKGLIVDSVKRALTVVDLFRSKDDDQGFYYLQVTEFDESMLVEYEGGLLLITKGEVVWHNEKLWNDKVRGVTTNAIVVDGLASDGEDCEYEIDIVTGARR